MSSTSTTSDTSNIDEVRNNSSTPPTFQNIGTKVMGFTKSIFITILVIFVYICLGANILYSCKVAQSNIVPTDINCFPYTESIPNIQPVTSNIFYHTENDKTGSQKIKFPYEGDNKKNVLLDMFRNYKEKPNSNFLANYFISIMESVLCFTYSFSNEFYNIINTNFSETAMLIFGPILLFIELFLLSVLNQIYMIYLYFVKMGWFFKKNISNKNEKPNWQNVSFLEPVSYMCSIALIFLFILLFFLAFVPVSAIFNMVLIITGFFTFLGYKGFLNEANTSSFSIVKKVFKYHKPIIMGIISFFIIMHIFSTFGGTIGGISVFIFLLVYFNIIPVHLFTKIVPTDLTDIVSDEKAKKVCKILPEKKIGLIDSLFPQKGGNDLVREIKKLTKKLKKNE